MHYLTVDRISSNSLYERYLDEEGIERSRTVNYTPSLFLHTQKDSEYKDIYGKPCEKRTFSSMYEADRWTREMKDLNLKVLGMDDYTLAYIADTYKGELKYDKSKIRIAVVDIEVTGDKFPDPTQAIYPVDAITHYDSVDDIFYVFDLLDNGSETVPLWNPSKSILSKEVLDRVVYTPYDTEEELLKAYIMLMAGKPPVIYSGWNSEGFDIPYLINRMTHLVPDYVNSLSPVSNLKTRTINNLYGQQTIHEIVGISSIDYMELYKKYSFTNLASYSLDSAATADNLEGKIPYDGPINKLRAGNYIPVKSKVQKTYQEYPDDELTIFSLCKVYLYDKLNAYISENSLDVCLETPKARIAGIDTSNTQELLERCKRVSITEDNFNLFLELYYKITELHKEASHQRYIDYNIGDVDVLLRMEEKRQFFELVISLALHAKIPFNAVFSPIKTWDAIIFNSLKEDKGVIPARENHQRVGYPGAYVREPRVGAHKHVVSFDFTSLNLRAFT